MAKKFNSANLDTIATDPIMDQTLGAIVGTSPEKKDPEKNNLEPAPKKRSAPVKEKKQKEKKAENKATYNYRKEERKIEGVGTIEKVISEKGRIIGRPNVPTKEKRKPITLTLRPELYDMVKEKALSDHRTTSEYLAIIIEEYFNK